MSNTTGIADNCQGDGVADKLVGLLASAAHGDQKSFRMLYDLTHRKLFRIAYLLLRSQDAAEDAVQEAYIRIWTRAGTYDAEKGTPISWMARIVRNTAIDRLRQNKAGLEDIDDHIDAVAVAPAPYLTIHKLHSFLSTMQPKQRQAWSMTHLEGFSREEVAARMQVPVGTIKAWVFRSSKRLKDEVAG